VATFAEPPIANPLPQPATFGTHAMLLGFAATHQDAHLQLDLVWQAQQPLLPPHHIFVHLYNATGQRIAQVDGEPAVASGRAPTGSWLTGEYLTTQHALLLPPGAQPPFTAQVGLYLPATGVRLPISNNGAIADSITLTLPLDK
jgi:hypothetical protein